MQTELSRPSALWKSLSSERRLEAARAFWADEQAVAEQAEVVGIIARQINFRPKSVITMPAERRASHLARMGSVSDSVAGRLLVSFHLARQRPMMAAFLDSLGIANEDGLISAEHVDPPDRAKLTAAADALASAFPGEDVVLYFSTLLAQDPETWGGLADWVAGR